MQPFSNPFQPQVSKQVQPNSSNVPVNQVFSMQSSLPNSMAMQPQVGIINPHNPNPFNGSNIHLSNGQMPNMPFLMPQQPGFMNTHHLGIPQMGFPPMNHVRSLGNIPMFVNQANPFQVQGQGFAPNFLDFAQQFNQSMCFPNFQSPLQSMNTGVPIQIPNHAQAFPYNAPSSSHQAMGPQNSTPFANPMFGVGMQHNPNQPSIRMPSIDANESKLAATQQAQGNSSSLQQTRSSQPSAFTKRQGNFVNNGQRGNSNPNWKNLPGKDFKRNQKRFQKPRNHNMDNGKRKFGFSNEQEGCEKTTRFGSTNPTPENQNVEKKRSLALTYTEQEIKHWREERRKNYPSKANIGKKQTDSKVIDREAKLRREQLKEILSKQAELGVEVAEIPPSYFSDSEKQQVHGRDDNNRSMNKRGRFRNKDKRGRYNKNDKFVKRQKVADKDSSGSSSLAKKHPTLLQKLLSADIRQDQRRLLQVFRFMVLNSFFRDWPEKPLKFPLVVVKEDGSKATGKVVAENFHDIGNNDEDDDDNKNDHAYQVSRDGGDGEPKTSIVRESDNLIGKLGRVEEEEEGEIID